MYLRKIFMIILMGTFFYQGAIAQQQYQLKHYGSPGTIYLYNRLLGVLPDQEIREAGDSIIWDLSAFGELNTHATEIVTPSEGIEQFTFITICALSGISPLTCFNIWSSTEQALLLEDSLALLGLQLVDLQRYQNKTNDLLLENFFGFTVDFGGSPTPAVIVYQTPDTILQFPVTYQDSFQSQVRWNLDLSATGMDLRYKSTQTRTTEVDAWGTLMTPYDTFTNVVRVRAAIHHMDTLFTDSLALPVDITQVEYMWLDTNYKLPVMVANGFATDSFETINVIEYIYEATCPAPTWSVLTQPVYYLDSTGNVNIDFVIEESNANIYTWNFDDGQSAETTGSTSHTYSVPDTYFVEVFGCMTNCLPLNSCSFEIIEFEIRDTISGVEVIPGAFLGIELYPNPAAHAIHLKLPDDAGIHHYNIFDVHGRQIASGKAIAGDNVISTGNWPDGLYAITLRNVDQPDQIGLLRFNVLKN